MTPFIETSVTELNGASGDVSRPDVRAAPCDITAIEFGAHHSARGQQQLDDVGVDRPQVDAGETRLQGVELRCDRQRIATTALGRTEQGRHCRCLRATAGAGHRQRGNRPSSQEVSGGRPDARLVTGRRRCKIHAPQQGARGAERPYETARWTDEIGPARPLTFTPRTWTTRSLAPTFQTTALPCCVVQGPAAPLASITRYS